LGRTSFASGIAENYWLITAVNLCPLDSGSSQLVDAEEGEMISD
jgi:hypothetical protein